MKTKQVLLTAILVVVSAAYSQQLDGPKPMPERVRISSGVMDGLLIHRVEPVYPAEAQKNQISGNVVLWAIVGKDGDVINLKTISGHPLLAEAATEAVKQWKYRPYTINGEPIEVETQVLVKFGQPLDSPRPTRIQVASGVAEGMLIRRVEPEYPLSARANHLQGDVILGATISKHGNIQNLRVISGAPVFAEASMDAVKQWKYHPYLLAGEPVEVETQILIKFHM
jgi:bla regulator protein blaR1